VLISENFGPALLGTRSPSGAAFTVAALPWNVALWWQLMRLRAAIELDCDKRVVADGHGADASGGVIRIILKND
jgi:hypothetical protein